MSSTATISINGKWEERTLEESRVGLEPRVLVGMRLSY